LLYLLPVFFFNNKQQNQERWTHFKEQIRFDFILGCVQLQTKQQQKKNKKVWTNKKQKPKDE
jgi:hypothetical protein